MKTTVISTLIILTLLSSCSTNNKQVAVVDLPLVYASFDYKKELMTEYESIAQKIEFQKDSLNNAINQVEINLKNSTYNDTEKSRLYEQAYSAYISSKEYMDFRKDSIAQAYTGKIWKHLNSYVADYGKAHDYQVIIGMQGNGNVMYVKESTNITDQVLAYANEKYNGE